MELTRRQVVKGMAAAAAGTAAAGLFAGSAIAAAKEVVIAQSGGQAGEALEKAYAKPFTAKPAFRCASSASSPRPAN
jgi:spermidine/putrescine-binding protein